MGIDDIYEKSKDAYEQFKTIDFSKLIAQSQGMQPWNGLTIEDAKNSYNEITSLLDLLFEADLNDLPLSFNSWNALKSQLDAVVARCNEFLQQKDQNRFQKVIQQIEGCRHNLLVQGVYTSVKIYPNVESIAKQAGVELGKLQDGNKRFDQLEKNLKNLAGKAVSGSLSIAFENLKKEVNASKWFWFFNVIGTVILVAIFAYLSLGKQGDKDHLAFWVRRLVVAVPAIYYLWFSMGQYRRERSLVQEYAHKAAVATSLPSYKDQLKDEKAKDDISVAASHVIFDAPRANDKEAGLNKTIKQVSELANAVNKLKT